MEQRRLRLLLAQGALWVQPDDKEDWELPDNGKYQLDWMADSDEGWVEETAKTLLTMDDYAAIQTEIKKQILRAGYSA